MKDNLSIVITVILLVFLMVIFPLYNFFERQDDMSFNIVLKATTNFADEIMLNGYIDQELYNNYVNQLANTGNLYDIQIEAHRRILTKDPSDSAKYIEQYVIDYNNDIFESIENSKNVTNNENLMTKKLKNNIYTLNEKDKIYIKVKNSNTTMAGAIFNAIVPTSKKTRIQVNYGGIIKKNSWAKVDSTYLGYNQPPSIPTIWIGSTEITGEGAAIKKNDIITNGITFSSQAYNSSTNATNAIERYNCKIDGEKVNVINNKLESYTFDENQDYTLEVSSIDKNGYSSDEKKVKLHIISNSYIITGIGNYVEEDKTVIKEYLAGNIDLTDEQKNLADVNKDGNITINDVYALQKQ